MFLGFPQAGPALSSVRLHGAGGGQLTEWPVPRPVPRVGTSWVGGALSIQRVCTQRVLPVWPRRAERRMGFSLGADGYSPSSHCRQTWTDPKENFQERFTLASGDAWGCKKLVEVKME